MPLFEYTGLSIEGRVSGNIIAGTARDAREELQKKGVKVKELRKRKVLNENIFWKCISLLKILMAQNITYFSDFDLESIVY